MRFAQVPAPVVSVEAVAIARDKQGERAWARMPNQHNRDSSDIAAQEADQKFGAVPAHFAFGLRFGGRQGRESNE